jgi:hypothetical protein
MFCKDCKHCAMPNPLANAYVGYPAYAVPMCAHPSAPRSPVDGRALATCSNARGEGLILRAETEKLDCGPDAKLFEQREPEPEHVPQPEKSNTQERPPGFWDACLSAIFGG